MPEVLTVHQSLRITEIFYSLQGEARHVGLPTIFIRLTGCPLRCHYCDTAYAFKGGKQLSFAEIFNQLRQYQTPYITVTGGEPLAQEGCISLLQLLCDQNYQVSLETSGALSLANVDRRVVKVMDLKTPSSGECDKNDYRNLDFLNAHDQIKFVMGDRIDFDWSVSMIKQHKLNTRCELLFSPIADQLSPTLLADWILAEQLPVRFQIQLHKYLWGDSPGR